MVFAKNGTPKTTKRSASRAENVAFPMDFNDFRKRGTQTPKKKRPASRAENVDFPKDFQ